MIYDMELVGAEVHEKSIDIATKFINLFSKYAVCHRLINGTEAFDQEKITLLGIWLYVLKMHINFEII